MDIFSSIAERKICESMEKGLFENLPGKGKPLDFESEAWIPEDLRVAYRVLKNAGHIPHELELRKEIINLKGLIDTIDDDKELLKKLRELNCKIMNLNMIRKRPLNLEDFPGYEDKIMEKMIA